MKICLGAMACSRSKKLRIILPVFALAMGMAHAAPISMCGPGVSLPGVQANPGGATVVTVSRTTFTTCIDTPVTAGVDQFATTLTAVLNGSQTVFQQTFALPFTDPAVQVAVAQADAILAADKASFKSPTLISNSTTLQSSVLSFVQTSPPFDPNTCGLAVGNVSTCLNAVLTNTTVDTFGPATILTGDNKSLTFFILPGQLDINNNVDLAFTVTRNAVTTNTFLTTQSFEIDGTSGPAGSVPEPASWALLLTGAAGMILLGWKKGG